MENIIFVLVFVSVTLFFCLGLPWYFKQRERIMREKSVSAEYNVPRKKSFIEHIRPVLQEIVKLNKKFTAGEKWLSSSSIKYEPQLLKAGFPGNITGEEFLALKQASSVFIISVMAFGFEMPFSLFYLFFLVFGFVLPDIWLADKIKRRQTTIARLLPDVMDTFALIVGAGLNFSEAINTYVRRSKPSPLKEEFAIVRNQIRLGRALTKALENMADRIGSNALTNFVTTVVQSQKTGTSLSEVLEAQAVDLRGRRFHIAEEMGQKAPIKMVFPLLLFIMPNVFIILFAPLALKAIYGS